MMADLIDRQAAIDMFQRMAYDDWNQGVSTTWANAFSECADMVADIPSADAVEVVRCKDCKHWDASDIHSTICPNNKRCKGIIGKMYTEPDYYCAYGERKDG